MSRYPFSNTIRKEPSEQGIKKNTPKKKPAPVPKKKEADKPILEEPKAPLSSFEKMVKDEPAGEEALEEAPESANLTLPPELEGYVEVEDCSDFNTNRYYVTKDIQNLYNDIMALQNLSDEMHELGINYLNTTLLFGLPGTGKTTFAKYMAHQLHLPFAYINFAKVMGGGFGETSKHISDVFRFIAKERCVFMLDEIDCVTARRSTNTGGANGELNRITITVMQELDYYKSHKVNSIILGATNREDTLDEALLSRFAIKHDMKYLSNEEKQEYLAMYLDDVGVPYDKDQIIGYCAENFLLEQRNMESDMIQSIARWITNGREGNVEILHIS